MVYRSDVRKGSKPKPRRRQKQQSYGAGNYGGRGYRGEGFGQGMSDALFANPDFGKYLQSILGQGASTLGNVRGADRGVPGGIGMQRVEPQTLMRGRPRQRKRSAQQESIDYLDQLMQGMLAETGSVTYDYESAIQDATEGIRSAYGAEIGAIRSNNKAARKQTKKGRREIEAMYAGLAKSYGRDAKQSARAGRKDARGMQNIGDQGINTLKKASSQINQEEAQLMKGLGIQEAAPEIIGDDNIKKDIGDIANRSSRYAQDARKMGNIDRNYFNAYSAGASFEGESRSADMLGALQDYVRQNRNEIASLKGQRSQEVGAAKSQIMGQAAEFQAEQDSLLWERMMDYMDLRQDIEDTNIDNRLQAQKFRWDQKMDVRELRDAAGSQESIMPKSVQNAASIISQNLPGRSGQRVMSVLQGLFSSPQFRFGSVRAGNGETYKLSPFQAAQMAERAGKQAGLSQQEINILRLAAMSSAE